ncbi:MAG: fructose-2,6-bisphosphatase [Gemmatimonadetes bacterium]|jgi:broad specificity phosphatase PhoE|nr:fructose-2,6-bisphosphatase [Gemmatimonadota bacterium]
MPLRLHLLRHGQTALSRSNVFCGRRLDPELTAEGVEMAGAFASAHGDTPWRAIYASPLQRALRTAAPVGARCGLAVQPHDGLAELDYGQWDGRSAEEVDVAHHDDYVRWSADPAWNAPTGGETAMALAQRMTDVVEEIRAGHDAGDVLVVSHKASIRVLLCALLGVDVGRFRYRFGCPVGSRSVVEFGPQGPLAVTVAERSHLTARLRELPGT